MFVLYFGCLANTTFHRHPPTAFATLLRRPTSLGRILRNIPVPSFLEPSRISCFVKQHLDWSMLQHGRRCYRFDKGSTFGGWTVKCVQSIEKFEVVHQSTKERISGRRKWKAKRKRICLCSIALEAYRTIFLIPKAANSVPVFMILINVSDQLVAPIVATDYNFAVNGATAGLRTGNRRDEPAFYPRIRPF